MQGGIWIFSLLAFGGTSALGMAALGPDATTAPPMVEPRPALAPKWHLPPLAPTAWLDAEGQSPAQLQQSRQLAAQVLFWPQKVRDENFPLMQRRFPSVVIRPSTAPRDLPSGASLLPALGGTAGVGARMAATNSVGLVVIRDGKIQLEQYHGAFTAASVWPSFSVAKSFTSTLVGAAIKDGAIASIDDPVVRYLPEMKGTAYDGVTIRQVITMTSGVAWNEDYASPKSDIARYYALSMPEGVNPTVYYMAKLSRAAAPGTKWNYNTGETNLLGVIVERATRTPLSAYMRLKIWQPAGMADTAYWMVDQDGHAIGGCCLSATTKDFARFGQFMLQGGKQADGTSVLPEGWIAQATGPIIPIALPGKERGGFYGYQWWTSPNSYDARGIFGQRIHIDPSRKLVIAINADWPTASNAEYEAQTEALIETIKTASDALS